MTNEYETEYDQELAQQEALRAIAEWDRRNCNELLYRINALKETLNPERSHAATAKSRRAPTLRGSRAEASR